MVPPQEPESIEVSVILCDISCDSTVEPRWTLHRQNFHFPHPSQTKKNDNRTTPTYTVKALFITPPGKLKL